MARHSKPPVLDVYIFYEPTCPRCKPMHALVHRAQKRLRKIGTHVRFVWMNLNKPHVQTIARRKYPCLGRIPTICAQNDIYWVGVPSDDDFVGVINYLAENPEGGKGAYHDE